MEEKKFRCESCERDFKSEDALKMHNSSKHSNKLKEKKTHKKSSKKVKNWIILLLVFGIISYGIFWMVGNSNQNPIPIEDELTFIPPTGEIHWHPTLNILIDGELQEITENIGITNNVHFPTHTHEDANVGVIHMENRNPTRETVTLGYFFEVWRKTFNKNCIFDSCTDEGELKMYVNDEENFDFDRYFMQDNDNILIEYNSFN